MKFRTTEIIDFAAILPTGKQNAVTAESLCQKLGLSDERQLRAAITAARQKGQLILSNCGRGGYYLPANEKETEEYVGIMKARGISTFKNIKSAREWLKTAKNDAYHQLSLDEILKAAGEDA